jgi:hypothetical protein
MCLVNIVFSFIFIAYRILLAAACIFVAAVDGYGRRHDIHRRRLHTLSRLVYLEG